MDFTHITIRKDYIEKVAADKHKSYPMNKEVYIKPYGLSPYLPRYKFKFTGQLDQFVKIYSTGAKGSNSYLSIIISYIKKNGLNITPDTKIQNIIKIN